MACIVLKKLLGYELCVLEKEGTLFYSDPIVIIRRFFRDLLCDFWNFFPKVVIFLQTFMCLIRYII